MPSDVTVRVPSRVVPVLAALADVDESEMASLRTALSGERLVSVDQFTERVRQSLSSQSSQQLDELVGVILSLASLSRSHGWSIQEIIDQLVRDPESRFDEARRAALAQRLADVLTAPSIEALTKAIDLVSAPEKTLHVVRIYSDVRPVFSDDTSSEPVGAVIIHNLILSYVADGIVHDINIACSSADLEKIRASAERGIQKGRSLEQFLERTSLTHFEVTAE